MYKSAALLLILWCFTQPIFSQDSLQVKTDSLKLEEFLLFPRKSPLPVHKPVLQIKQIEIPSEELHLKINYWKTWYSFGVNINQSSFSNNWSAGGVNSLALGTIFNFKTDYTKGDKNYTSEVILQYGKLKNKDQIERKINDRIFYDNKVALKLSKSWSFFGSLNFESQFDKGYTYSKDKSGNEIKTLISRFMSPGYLTESVGFEYKPSKSYYLRIGTGTARQTFVLDTSLYRTNSKNFGVKPGRTFRNELAFQIVSSIDKDIMENVNLKSRYTLFANYEKLRAIDHRLDITLSARVNRLINVSLTGTAIYDDDASTKIQASQGLALGLLYKFPMLK